MKYFTMTEFTRSETATRLGIDNTPSKSQKEHIIELVDNLLDPLREAWGKYCRQNRLGSAGIRINSGIRSEQLNEAVGGSKTSAHYVGYAADIAPCNGKMKEFNTFCWNWLQDKDFDQMILEKIDENGIPSWIHIGYKNRSGYQRHQFLYMKNGKYYSISDLLIENYL